MTIPASKLRRARLLDIAETAGVSVSTVSLVLGNKARQRRISEEVISRVSKVATDLDYSPNAVAQSLQGGRTNTISFFDGFRRLYYADDMYMDKLTAGIQLACGEFGYDLLLTCDFSRSTEETYKYINGGRCDGLVLFAASDDEPLLPYLKASHLRTVLLNGTDPSNRIAAVSEDCVSGMSQMAGRLVSLGHRRIAAFSHTVYPNQDSILRVQLLRKFLAAYDIEIPDRWVLSTCDSERDYAERDLERILAEPDPPTVIFCWHDRLGYQVLDHCVRRNINVPGDISIIGYDGIKWPSGSFHVLASVNVNIQAIAHEAIKVLNELINNPAVEPSHHTVPVTLSMGTTLAPPKA